MDGFQGHAPEPNRSDSPRHWLQFWRATAPSSVAAVPGGHGVGTPEPAGQKVSRGHGVAWARPPGQWLPAGQGSQVARDVVERVPGAQSAGIQLRPGSGGGVWSWLGLGCLQCILRER